MEHDDDAVLAAAFSLIDEVYSSVRSHHVRQRNEIARLRHEVDGLTSALDRAHSDLYGDGTQMAQIWAQIARSQRDERLRAIRENALLREAATTQVALARRALKNCDELLRMTRQQSIDIERCLVLERSLMPAVLQQELDRICREQNSGWATPRPPIGTHRRERQALYSDSGDTLRFQFQFAGYYPFKLSVVAKELWGVVIEDTLGSENLGPDTNQVCGHITVERVKPFGRFAIHGPTMVRRYYTKDGGVMIGWASVTSSILNREEKSPNLMAGLELIESGSLRLTRVPSSTHKHLVYVETSTHIHVAPAVREEETALKLRHIEEFMLRLSKEEGDFNRQKVENRLLDAAIADCRRSMC